MKQTFSIIACAALLVSGVLAGDIVIRTACVSNADPAVAGKAAAEALKAAMGGAEPQFVLAVDCFEDRENKEKMLKGVGSVFSKKKICGGSVYGVYTQAGVMDQNAVSLLGVGGDGVTAQVVFEEKMGAVGLTVEKNNEQLAAALQGAGKRLAGQLSKPGDGALLMVIADAHSPKNQLLLDGIQSVVGKKLRVAGGSVNKNAGQNWVYYKGKVYNDSALGVLLTGKFDVTQSGRQAKVNDAVIATAGEGSAAAVKQLGKPPFAVLAFDCAGRKGKLNKLSDELDAIQASIGKDVPLFGCYCAGEFGPADATEGIDPTICYGRGWHVMVSALGK